MQPATDQTIPTDDQIRANGFVASRLADDMSWGEGAIVPQTAYASDEQQHALIETVLQNIEPVTAGELTYSSCTDGRIPVKLASGEPIPVREQLVGADMVSAFYVAEVLGADFYVHPEESTTERICEVAAFLRANDLLPSSHVACGAAGGFAAIMQNVIRYSSDERFVSRVRALLPDDVYDESLHADMLKTLQHHLDADDYKELTAQTFLDAVQNISGDRAIAELQDDGRGVHGHVEEAIIRVRVPGYAINEAKVANVTDSREVFGVNDNRIEKLARLFARGNETNYKKAYMALEDFADAGHGTLAKQLPTWVVAQA